MFVGRHAGTALLLLMSVAVVAILRSVQRTLIAAAQEAEARAQDLTRLNQELRTQEQRRESAEDALRQSQLALISEPATSHPFNWAAFTLIGDGDASLNTVALPGAKLADARKP